MASHEDLGHDEWPTRSRELFLTDLWSLLIDEDDRVDGCPSWIESWLRGTPSGGVPDHPTAAALHRMLASGIDVDDLTDVVRTMQYEILYNVCQLLDDPALLGIRTGRPPHARLAVAQARAGDRLAAVRTWRGATGAAFAEAKAAIDSLLDQAQD